MSVKVKYCEFPKGIIEPVSSKSISNRALIIHALTGETCAITNLSKSEDTQTLVELLDKLSENKSEYILNVGPAGTAMRFLMTYCCLTGKKVTLTGSERMLERPQEDLINALRSLGARINCLGKEGFAPLEILPAELTGGKIKLNAGVSSQFVTSLMLCAPYIKNGLEIELGNRIVSASYIHLTIEVMKYFDASVEIKDARFISVKQGQYKPKAYTIEGDWSSASYFYSLASLSKKADIEMKNMNLNSFQGDIAIHKIAALLGVETKKTSSGIIIKKTKSKELQSFEYDFLLCPDIAQTVAPMLAAHGVKNVSLKGLATLVLKETNRIQALEIELKKFNVSFPRVFSLGTLPFDASGFMPYTGIINTYDDHRMAMGFAPLAQKTGELIIQNEDTVKKSYIRYWDDLKSLGCIVENSDI